MPQNENASFSSNKKNWKECIYLMWQKIFLDTFTKEVSREWWIEARRKRVDDQMEVRK